MTLGFLVVRLKKSRELFGLFFCGAQAARANIADLFLAVNHHRGLVDVGVESAFCLFVRVAYVVACHFALAAHNTYFAHVF